MPEPQNNPLKNLSEHTSAEASYKFSPNNDTQLSENYLTKTNSVNSELIATLATLIPVLRSVSFSSKAYLEQYNLGCLERFESDKIRFLKTSTFIISGTLCCASFLLSASYLIKVAALTILSTLLGETSVKQRNNIKFQDFHDAKLDLLFTLIKYQNLSWNDAKFDVDFSLKLHSKLTLESVIKTINNLNQYEEIKPYLNLIDPKQLQMSIESTFHKLGISIIGPKSKDFLTAEQLKELTYDLKIFAVLANFLQASTWYLTNPGRFDENKENLIKAIDLLVNKISICNNANIG